VLSKIHIQLWFLSLAIVATCGFYFLSIENTLITIFLISVVLLASIFLLTKADWFYLLLIALIPISIESSFVGGSKLNLPSEPMIVILLAVLFLFHKKYWSALKRIAFHPISILLMVDLFVQLLTSLTSTHLDVSLKRFILKFLFIAFFYVVVHLFERPKSLTIIFIAYTIGLIPVMFLTIKNHSKYNFDPRVVFDICAPYFNDHTVYGACLAFVIPMIFLLFLNWKQIEIAKEWRFAFGLLFAFLLASEMMALSRAAILSLIFVGLFAVLLHFRIQFKVLMSLFFVIIVAVIASWNTIYKTIETNESVSNDGEIVNHFSSISNVRSDASNLERINRWICAVRMFQEKPLLGFGPGTYQFEYNNYQTIENKTYISTNLGDRGNAHSEYLTYLSENGILGFLLFFALVIAVVYYGMLNHYSLDNGILRTLNLGVLLGLLTFFFHGIFNMFIDQVKMAALVYSSIGIIVWIHLAIQSKKQLE